MVGKEPIAIGVGALVGVALLCCVCWGVWKLRHRFNTGQISVTPEEIPVENPRNGLKKEVVITIPNGDSVKIASASSSPKSVTVEATDETLAWVLVNRPVPLPRIAAARSSSSSDRFEIELNPSDSVSTSGEAPLLKHLVNESHVAVEEWSNVDLDKCVDISFTFGTEIPVEKRHSPTSGDKAGAVQDSFSFGNSSKDILSFAAGGGVAAAFAPGAAGAGALDAQQVRTSLRRKESSSSSLSSTLSSSRHSRSTSRTSRSSTNSFSTDSSFRQSGGWGPADHLPLTRPPDQCAFDVLPVVNGLSENYSLTPFQGSSKYSFRVASNRSSYYSQL